MKVALACAIGHGVGRMSLPWRLLYRSPFSIESRNARMFLTATTAVCLSLAGLTGNRGFVHAQTASQAKTFRPPYTLPRTSFYDTPPSLSPGKPGELIRSEPTDEYHLPFELSAWRILYHSRTAKGEDVPVSAVVLVPDGKPPAGGWPVIAWAHEFRGTPRQCAPSMMKNLGVGPLLAMYANLGYAVVATDYSGLGAGSGNPMLDMQSNAFDMIYSVPAARAAVTQIGPKWIALGPFQGGLAAVAVAESEVRDPNYLGSVATSGLADAEQAYLLLIGIALVGLTMLAAPLPAFSQSCRALLHPGGLRWRSHDSGIAQWDSDPCRPAHVHVGRYDSHCLSQAQSVQTGR